MTPEEKEYNEKIVAFLEGKHYRYVNFDNGTTDKWISQEALTSDDRYVGSEMDKWDIEHIRNGIISSHYNVEKR